MHVRVVFIDKRESRSGPHGIVIERTEMINQDGAVVIDAEHATLLFRKAAAGQAAAQPRAETRS